MKPVAAHKMARRSSRQERDAADLQLFVKQYARRAQKGKEPNDRQYDRTLQDRARRIRPEQLDALLRDGEDDQPKD